MDPCVARLAARLVPVQAVVLLVLVVLGGCSGRTNATPAVPSTTTAVATGACSDATGRSTCVTPGQVSRHGDGDPDRRNGQRLTDGARRKHHLARLHRRRRERDLLG